MNSDQSSDLGSFLSTTAADRHPTSTAAAPPASSHSGSPFLPTPASPSVQAPSSGMTVDTAALLEMYMRQQQQPQQQQQQVLPASATAAGPPFAQANTASFLGQGMSAGQPSLLQSSYVGNPSPLLQGGATSTPGFAQYDGYQLQQPPAQHLQHQQQQQQEPQQVLVLLPNTVNLVNLNLMQVVAEAQKKMGRPIAFSDLVLTVAATPLISATETHVKKPTMVDSAVQTDPADIRESGVQESGIVEESHVDSAAEAIWDMLDQTDEPAQAEPTPPTPAAKPTATHPFPADIVTTHRPAGDGPAPYHVTLRALRPSVTTDALLSLARDTKSLAKVFIPYFAPTFHLGRAATYFFHDKTEAFQFCMGLRKRADELQPEYGLAEEHLEAAKRRGITGTKPTRLTVTMSDQKKREKMAAHAEAVKAAKQARKQGGASGEADEEHGEGNDEEAGH